MFLKIDFESDMPIYEQLRRQLIIGLANGELKAGEELPSVRQLGGDIGINLHTVNKAYNILKNEGYLTSDRRTGTVVKNPLPIMETEYIEKLKEELDYLIADSKNRGMSEEEFLKIVRSFYTE